MTMQPTPPSPPVGPILSAQERASIADGIRHGHAIQQQAQREVQQVVEQTNREIAQTGQNGNTSVVKDGGGRIVVTGPNGKTVVIDPKVGLDGDQVQEMVQTALQPVQPPSAHDDIPKEIIPIFGIMFPCLAAMVFFITRMFTARRVIAGSTTAILPPETVARLARIEQAVEAVAIEVERISEGQRYSAQLLTDRLTGSPATAPAVPVAPRPDVR